LNERDTLQPLVERLTEVLGALDLPEYEILIIDDGSTDGSWEVLRELGQKHAALRAFRLRRCFGKSSAIMVAGNMARGDIFVMMDADLQDEPAEIPAMLRMLERERADLVSGWKKVRHDPLEKRVPSRIFNFVVGRLSGLPLRDFNCGFKAYRREVFEGLRLYGELHRYIPVLAHDKGFLVKEIPVEHHPRRHGKSKFGLERYIRGFLDLLTVLLITRFARRPGHFFGSIGVGLGIISFLILAYLGVIWFVSPDPVGTRPLFQIGVMLGIVAVQFVFFGLLAELILHNAAQPDWQRYIREKLPMADAEEPQSRG
jgi:glycosyltransferase involved in cell wall biosynthesis